MAYEFYFVYNNCGLQTFNNSVSKQLLIQNSRKGVYVVFSRNAMFAKAAYPFLNGEAADL